MKKVLAIAVTVCMLISCVVMANASYTEFDAGQVDASINNRSTVYYAFRDDMTNSYSLDESATTNFIIEDDEGEICVKFDAKEAWHSDNPQGEDVVISIDLKPTVVTGLAGMYVYGDPYNGAQATTMASITEGYPTTGAGMTIDTDCQNVVIFFGEATYKFDTGLDLKADWHTYAAYIESGIVTFAIDEEVVATVESGDGSVTIYDNQENEVATVAGEFYTGDARCGYMITGEGMDILGDNLIFEEFDDVPTKKFGVEEEEVEETEAPAEETEAPVEETEAPAEETEAPVEETEAPAEETAAEEEKSGCGSVVMSGAAVVMMAACALVLKKKEL